MNLSRRLALALATTTLGGVGVLAPGLAGAMPVNPPEDPRPGPVTTRRATTTTARAKGVDPTARYVVQADLFFCSSETGQTDWNDSDEPRFDFVGTDETGQQTVTAKQFSGVDTGEGHFFGPLNVSAPMAGPFVLTISVRELNLGAPGVVGDKTLSWTPEQLAMGTPTVGSTSTEQVDFTGDGAHYSLFIRTSRVA